MSHAFKGVADNSYAIPYPPRYAQGWFTLALVLAGCSMGLIVLARWFGPTPHLYGVLFGTCSLIVLLVAASRWSNQGQASIWLDGDMLIFRSRSGTGSLNLEELGGAYASASYPGPLPIIFLEFRTEAEEEEFVRTGTNPPLRPPGYLNRVDMAKVVGIDSMLAQYFADEINRRRGLAYKWPAQIS